MALVGQNSLLWLGQPDHDAQLLATVLKGANYLIDVALQVTDGLRLADAKRYAAVILHPLWLTTAHEEAVLDFFVHVKSPVVVVASEPLTPAVMAVCRQLPVAGYFVGSRQAAEAPLLLHLLEQILTQQRFLREQDRIFHALQQDNRNLNLLTRLAQLLSSTLEMGEVISQLVRAITEIVITEGSSVWLWDNEEEGALVCAAMYLNQQDITASQMRLPPRAGVVGWVAHHGQLVNISDAKTDARFSTALDQQTGFVTRSILAVPLVTRNQVIGVLEFVNKLDGDFDEQDCELAETVAVYAANAIENARLMASLSWQRDLLERQNDALDAFAHSVAHDLKNPLTLVIGFADLLRDGIATLPAASISESLDMIVEYSVKMSQIVDALLLLANIDADDEVMREPVDTGAIVTAVLRRIDPMVREYNAVVISPPEWPTALGFSPWLEEVWYNYLSNGLKYGGRPPRLTLGYDLSPDGSVRFWVEDNGAGIKLDDPLLLFSPHHRRRRTGTGYGLGLSIVQRIIHRLGGAVSAETVAGGGSRFWFTLPAAPPITANRE